MSGAIDDRIAQRYLDDVRFHQWVQVFRYVLSTHHATAEDLRDALQLATVFTEGDLERQTVRRPESHEQEV
ncbi:MAG TPA: hypothetical protein VN803_04045 [Gemmatimonadales bacterium]|nr:hypothetical protein [Gemmatimonadales bacterium]